MYFGNQIASPIPGSIHVGLALAKCDFARLSLRTRAAGYSDECLLYWGGISFTTARPLVRAICFVGKRFPQEIT